MRHADRLRHQRDRESRRCGGGWLCRSCLRTQRDEHAGGLDSGCIISLVRNQRDEHAGGLDGGMHHLFGAAVQHMGGGCAGRAGRALVKDRRPARGGRDVSADNGPQQTDARGSRAHSQQTALVEEPPPPPPNNRNDPQR